MASANICKTVSCPTHHHLITQI